MWEGNADKMLETAKAVTRSIRHMLAYVHMPVPAKRADDGFFMPLRHLELTPEKNFTSALLAGTVSGDA